MTRHLCLALLLASCVAPVVVADYYDGLAAFKRGDYEDALEEWKPLAEQGFAEAQYEVARMYHRGYAVQDDVEAASWYRKAADQGHLRAQNDLGVLYERGEGVAQDEAEAASWYLEAAREGLIVAQANLGVLYDEGRGVPEDAREAARWYRLAGEAGHVNSQYRLAKLYSEGRGVPADDRKAASWYRKGAKQGHAESQLILASIYDEGRGVGRDPAKAAKWRREATMQGLTSTEPEEAEPEISPPDDAAALVTESAPQIGDAAPTEAPSTAAASETTATEATAVTGGAATEGPAPPDDVPPALAGLRESAASGDVDAAYDLARRYASGDGVPLSYKEAGHWYLVAAEGGHRLAGYKLAFQYFRGRGITKSKDPVRAHYWFSVSAERGVGDAAAWRDTVAKKLSKLQLEESRELLAEREQRDSSQ